MSKTSTSSRNTLCNPNCVTASSFTLYFTNDSASAKPRRLLFASSTSSLLQNHTIQSPVSG
ncbi:MAG: hypothetical protein ACP5GJ_02745 [Nanopusillaceae archaeon]